MKDISISVNPTYYCNFRCDFCYLTEEQLSDRKRLPLDKLTELIDELSLHFNVNRIDLYGGEPLLLPKDYLLGLTDYLNLKGIEDKAIITNLSTDRVNDLPRDWDIYVSYDFDVRERSDEVFSRLLTLNRDVGILMLASPKVVKMDQSEIIDTLNLLGNIMTFEVKPYSPNQANQLNVSYLEYEEFVKGFIKLEDKMNFTFNNILNLEDVIDKVPHSYSDDHIYITPNGKLAVLEFDEKDNEFFMELDSVDDFIEWTMIEKKRATDSYCNNCKYEGVCLTEHLRHVDDVIESCNGGYKLIEWFTDYA